ncbi:MAG: WG repeat-containing protein [Chitinophagaceae bacterium]
MVKKGKFFGYVNKKGKEQVAVEYSYLSPFQDGMPLATKNGKSFFINTEGNVSKIAPKCRLHPQNKFGMLFATSKIIRF